ncbi:hypothetical protein [Pectinatus frisingensis]|uniref:hypothetical protein n=1 Tax=Pectinatus frisingensis TaxID=865 RepID=UPI001E2D19EA|nr:hypothetical protein [Pectinatus frisingensis]
MSGLDNAGSANTQPRTYLSCNGSKIQFPMPPATFDVSVVQQNSTININNIGELNMLGKTGLLTLSFSSFFPAQNYPFCLCTPDAPYNYVKTIDVWRTSGKPCRFSIAGTSVNYAVSIDKFVWGEHDGTSDVYYTLDFREYKFIGGATDSTISDVTGMKDRTDTNSMLDVLQSVTVYPSDSIGDVVGRAIGKNLSMGQGNSTILDAYKSIAKSGGINTGDILTYAKTTNALKVNNKNV